MDTREWKERFDRLKPDEQLDVLMVDLCPECKDCLIELMDTIRKESGIYD